MSGDAPILQFEIRTRDAGRFVADLSSGMDAGELQRKYGADSSLSETPARDPRRFGVAGAYPRVGKRPSPQLMVRLYEEVGTWSTLVDTWTEATWGTGWKLITKNEAWKKAAEELDRRLETTERFEMADTWVLQHGHAGIYYNLEDRTDKPEDEPRAVRDVLRLTVLDGVELYKANKNPDGEVGTFEARFEQGPRRVHAKRVLLLREKAKNHALRGFARFRPAIDDTLLVENTKWSSGETLHQRAAPFLQVVMNPGIKVKDETEAQNIHEKVAQLQSGLIQRVIAENFKLEAVQGSSATLNPIPHWNVALDAWCISTRTPRHMVVGTAAGALQSAEEDTRRFNARITRRRTKLEKWVFAHYDRLHELGMLDEKPKDLQIVWPNLHEPTTIEVVETAQKAANAAFGWARVKLPVPIELAEVLTFPEGVDLTQPLEVVQTQAPTSTQGGSGPGSAQNGFERGNGDAFRLPLPKLQDVEARFRVAILDALREWRAQAEKAVERATRRRFRIFEAEPEDAHRALMSIRFTNEALEEVLRELMEEAAELGVMDTWSQLGKKGKLLKFVETGRAPAIRQFVREYTTESARAATEVLHQVVAENIARGGSVADLKDALRATFGRLENEAAIARTETMRGYNNGSLVQMKESGVRRYRHRTWEGACPICTPLDGQEYDVDDASGLPPSNTHPNCRCYPEPVIPA